MIQSFRCRDTEALFAGRTSTKWKSIERVAQRKLKQLHAATILGDLAVFPGNRLQPLKGNRAGQHSIRVNNQYRICFVWKDSHSHDVEIVDYH